MIQIQKQPISFIVVITTDTNVSYFKTWGTLLVYSNGGPIGVLIFVSWSIDHAVFPNLCFLSKHLSKCLGSVFRVLSFCEN